MEILCKHPEEKVTGSARLPLAQKVTLRVLKKMSNLGRYIAKEIFSRQTI